MALSQVRRKRHCRNSSPGWRMKVKTNLPPPDLPVFLLPCLPALAQSQVRSHFGSSCLPSRDQPLGSMPQPYHHLNPERYVCPCGRCVTCVTTIWTRHAYNDEVLLLRVFLDHGVWLGPCAFTFRMTLLDEEAMAALLPSFSNAA